LGTKQQEGCGGLGRFIVVGESGNSWGEKVSDGPLKIKTPFQHGGGEKQVPEGLKRGEGGMFIQGQADGERFEI